MKDPHKKLEPDCTVIFSHIPKTAGQTLTAVIQRQYKPAITYKTETESFWESLDLFKKLPDGQRKNLRLIMGHMIFGFHEYLDQPYTYITVLRDPVDRVISYYYYIRRYSGNYLHEVVTSQNMSLRDLVSTGISREFDNLQTRRLSGNDRLGFGQCSPQMLEQAKQNLRLHFGVVGIMENFDETLMLMKSTFGWKNCFYEKKNVTKNKPPKTDIPEDTLAVIEEHNKLDMELYRHAQRMFEDQIGQLGQGFHNNLKKFRSLNNLYQILHPAMLEIKRKLVRRNYVHFSK